MSDTIVLPIYYQIVQKSGKNWTFKQSGEVFYNPAGKKVCLSDREKVYNLTKQKIAIELFRLKAGRDGYYLANLRDKKYYYCGTEWEDLKNTLISLGIGREDPHSL